MSSKSKAKELKEQLEKCSVSVEMISANDEESLVKEDIIRREKFNVKVLITTKVLDNGVTLKDYNIRHIIIDTISKTEFLQMLGRKRFIDEDDKATVYLGKKSLKQFAAYEELDCKVKLDFLCAEHTIQEIFINSKRDNKFDSMVKQFIYVENDTFLINEWAVIYYEKKYQFVKRMHEQMAVDEWAFVKEQLNWLGIPEQFDEKNVLHSENITVIAKELFIYLDDICGQELDERKKDGLSNEILDYAIRMKESICKPSRIPKKSVINKFLEKNKIPYRVESIKGRRKGEKTKWIVQKI